MDFLKTLGAIVLDLCAVVAEFCSIPFRIVSAGISAATGEEASFQNPTGALLMALDAPGKLADSLWEAAKTLCTKPQSDADHECLTSLDN